MASTESKAPRFFDVVGEEMDQLRLIEEHVRAAAKEGGYEEVRTTAVELRSRYLAATKVHPSKIFEVRRPKEGTTFALQADLALGMSRYAADRPTREPIKLVQTARLYRDRPPQHPGYRREFEQTLFGTWGLQHASADAEAIRAAVNVLQQCPGIEIAFVQITSQRILDAVADGLGERIRFSEEGFSLLQYADLKAGDLSILRDLCGVERVTMRTYFDMTDRLTGRRLIAAAAHGRQVGNWLRRLTPEITAPITFSLSNQRGTGHYSGENYQVWITSPGRTTPYVVADGGRIDHLGDIFNSNPTPGVCMGIGVTVLAQMMQPLARQTRVALLLDPSEYDDISSTTTMHANKIREQLRAFDIPHTLVPAPQSAWRSILRSEHYRGYGFVLVEPHGWTVRLRGMADESAVDRALLPLEGRL